MRALKGFIPMVMPAATTMTAPQVGIKRMSHGGFDLGGRFDKPEWVEYGSNARSYFFTGKSHIYSSVLSMACLTFWFPIMQGNSPQGLWAALGGFV